MGQTVSNQPPGHSGHFYSLVAKTQIDMRRSLISILNEKEGLIRHFDLLTNPCEYPCQLAISGPPSKMGSQIG